MSERQITIPQFCQPHMREAVDVLGLGPQDPWRAGVIIANLLMAGLALDQGVDTGLSPNAWMDAGNGQCLACRFAESWRQAKLCLFKGDAHAAKVSRREIRDEDCPLLGAPITPPSEPGSR